MARALGIDDSVTTCDCCGKSGLKSTVAMELDSGDIVHYGCVCATRNTGKAQKTITSEIRAERARKVELARDEWRQHPANAAHVSEAASVAQKEIAGRYGLMTYEFDCWPA